MCLRGGTPEAPINEPSYSPSQIDQNMKLSVDDGEGAPDIIQAGTKIKGPAEKTTSSSPGLRMGFNEHS